MVTRELRRLTAVLPKGRTLPQDVWARRHRGILTLLWAHVPAIFAYAVHQGVGIDHAAVETVVIAVFAWGATALRGERRWSTIAAAIGLLTCSAVLVHLSGGVIEMHFHFFVVIGIVTLYQDWEPFLIAIGYVVVEHGIGGALIPGAVYNHAEGVADPWKWAAIHGAFILAMSSAGVASWRLNESLIAAVSHRQHALADAQRVALLGSWDWDLRTNEARWSEQMYDLVGLSHDVTPTYDAFIRAVHPADRETIVDLATRAAVDGLDASVDCRIVRPDGTERWMHVRSHRTEVASDGTSAVISGTMQDITDRIAADDELRETLSLLEATLDATADGILVVDLDGVVTTMNERFVELWGLPEELARVGVSAQDLTAWAQPQMADAEAFLARLRAVQLNPSIASHDLVEFADGRVFERYSTPQLVGGLVAGRVTTFHDVTEQKRLQDELAHQAFHDPLTGLANQALFRALVEHAVARTARDLAPTAVLFIDLDDFKTVNDSLGHTVGDELLVAVAERLRTCVRPADTTARLGGDEFAVLLEDATREATEIADRIADALRRPFAVAGKSLYVSASIGIAFGHETVDGDQLLRNADLAMYTAKRKGRGLHEVYAPDMHAAAIDRLELEADLRSAVQREELVVHYQPISGLGDGATHGVEALVRWQHPTRGFLAPDMFIPIAEQTGQINDVGGFVLDVACAQAKEWQRATGNDDFFVSVNLSPRQLLDEHIVLRVAAALATTGLRPSTLVLEITENAMVQDTELAIERLVALKGLGVRLAIDDFGTGYSSLSYLQRFPIDIVKIDRSFVEQIGTSPEESSLAAAIIRLGEALHLLTVAEGIETEAQVTHLRSLGCGLGQGYHLARPSDAASITALLTGLSLVAAS